MSFEYEKDTPPPDLNEYGIRYWKLYAEFLSRASVIDFALLHDLCYWEQKKEQAKEDLQKIGRDFIAYAEDDGNGGKRVKHTQPVAPMNNLKTAQSNVNTLRDKLFDADTMESIKKKSSHLRSVKNF